MTQLNPTGQSAERLLRLPEVISRVSLSKSSIYEMMARKPPAFPHPIKLSRRAVCWPESSISKFVAECIMQDARRRELPGQQEDH